jgi:type IV secretion system protein VirD4
MSRHGRGGNGWGPSHQTDPHGGGDSWLTWIKRAVALVLTIWWLSGSHPAVPIAVALAWIAARVGRRLRRHPGRWWRRGARTVTRADSLEEVRAQITQGGSGPYLGTDDRGAWRQAGRERAVLVLGPPRSGKSSAVMIPSLLAHSGPAVSASTKPDVSAATVGVRSRVGTTWRFDPVGDPSGPGGLDVEMLRWSPVSSSGEWDGALAMARSMVSGAGVGVGTTDATHWAKRATALLAALLHAAAMSDQGIAVVVDWVLAHELDAPGLILETAGARQACGVLAGLANTEARERSSICSAAADAIDAYTSDSALRAASDPNFAADAFVRGEDTIYVHAAAESQALAAPLVCGLLADIRRATYRAHRAGELTGAVLWALDEVANIAPLPELPAVASEGGGQGLILLAALQDLSQARARWGTAADGFLTLFGSKVILPGVADTKTLEAISTALGEYDRRLISHTRGHDSRPWRPQVSETMSTHRQRVLSPGDVANIPAGRALHLEGVGWALVTLTPAYRCDPWRTLTQLPSLDRDPVTAIETEVVE